LLVFSSTSISEQRKKEARIPLPIPLVQVCSPAKVSENEIRKEFFTLVEAASYKGVLWVNILAADSLFAEIP
jgi:hypothetical protein